MKKFIGKQKVKAKPMTREQYNSYRNWETPENENKNDKGMLIEFYLNHKNPNHKNHKGHITWNPLDVFNGNYQIAETHKDRIIIEAQNLAVKTNALNDFMRTQEFVDLDRENKDLLYKQSRLMNEYLQILGQRIELLGWKFLFEKK